MATLSTVISVRILLERPESRLESHRPHSTVQTVQLRHCIYLHSQYSPTYVSNERTTSCVFNPRRPNRRGSGSFNQLTQWGSALLWMAGSSTRRIHTAYRFSIPIIRLPVAKALHIAASNGVFRTSESRSLKIKREIKREIKRLPTALSAFEMDTTVHLFSKMLSLSYSLQYL
jgi:hypothetical protein